MGDDEKPVSPLKKALGFLCRHCPVCSYGRRRPESLVGRILHSPLHADHCPFWKAEKEAYPPEVPAR